MTGRAGLLLAGLFFAHFLGDFTPLATPRMQRAKAVGRPVLPIAAHGAVHAALLTVVAWLLAAPGTAVLATVAAVEFSTHFGIDWLKGRLASRYPALADPKGQPFWTGIGVDQLAHSVVLIAIAAVVLRA